MNVTSFHIQHVIKAYGQRVGRRSSGGRVPSGICGKPVPDIISISAEAKRRQVMDQITSDIVSRAKGRDITVDLDQSLVEKIGQHLNGSIDPMSEQDGQPDFRFRVLSEKDENGEVIKELSIHDMKKMVESLYSDEINNGE